MPVTHGVTGSSPVRTAIFLWVNTGALVQLVRIHACHAWGHGFESRTHRLFAKIAQLVEHDLAKVGVAGSSPVFRSPLGISNVLVPCPDGGIGRRAGLKHQ